MTPLSRAAAVVLAVTVVVPAAAALGAPGRGLGSPTDARPVAAMEGSAGIPPSTARRGAVGSPPSTAGGGWRSDAGSGRPGGEVVPGGGVGPRTAPQPGGSVLDRVGAARPRWRWPVTPRPPVVRPFRAPLTSYGPGHRGLDLGAREGSPVLAVEAGRVTHAGLVAGRGTVTVEHAGGLRSTYEPVAASVRAGDSVTVGDELGRVAAGVAAPHCGVRVCLHLGALAGGTHVDPLPLLVGGRLALLPLR